MPANKTVLPKEVAQNLIDLLRRNGKDCVTFTYKEFLDFSKRTRLSNVVLDTIGVHLRKHGFIMASDVNIILVCVSSNFSPSTNLV